MSSIRGDELTSYWCLIMAELLTLSIEIIKKIATNGADELVKFASANGHTTEAVRLAVKRATRDSTNTALRGYAQTAASKTSKEAIKRSLQAAAKKAAEATIRAGTGTATSQFLPRVAQSVFRFGTAAARFYIPQILLLTLLAAGIYVLWHQVSGSGKKKSPSTSQQTVAADLSKGKTKEISSAEETKHSQSSKSVSKKSGAALWSKGWAGSGRRIVAKSHGALITLSISEFSDGFSGTATYFNSREQRIQSPVTVTETSDGYRISYETEAGNVRGDLAIDDESGYLLGTLIMPSRYGGLVDVSLIPNF